MPKMSKTSNTNNYLSNGVIISPSILSTGERVRVIYDGLLSKSGANHIYAKVGFGSKWEKEGYFQMIKSDTGFETTIPVANADTMNLAFKDCANNWDNNSGKNYIFDVTQ